jgi:uncharacterized protein DUF5658
VVPILLPLLVAHLFDLSTFSVMVVRHGLAAEANPVVAAIADQLGLVALVAGKLALVVYLAAAVLVISGRHPRMAAGLLLVGTVAGLFGGFSNVATL